MTYIIVPEYISCVMLALIGVYSLFNKSRPSPKETAFHISLAFAIIAIINNILSIYAIEHATKIPLGFSIYFNSFYYFSVAVMGAMIPVTTYFTMFSARYHERRLKVAVVVSAFWFFAEIVLVILNIWTKWIFYFDAQHVYHKGPLNAVGIAFLGIAVINIICFYLLERKRVKKSFRLVIYTLLTIGILLGTIQLIFPNTILTGTITGFSLLTLFITGQQQRARVDELTEISNREAFFSELSRLSAKKEPFRAVLVRLRNFKIINNQYGQRVGDSILNVVAQYVSQIDARVLAYRMQGVEFALIVTRMKDEEYESFFSELIERFSRSWHFETGEATFRALFADIRYPELASNVDEVIGSLEYAMRVAKSEMFGRPVRFDEKLRTDFQRRNYVIARMEAALRDDNFYLNFQPVYNTRKQQFSGGEVLLRLNEETGRPISPGEFIPIAIESGIATELGLMVMEKVCQFLHTHADVELGWLSINVSSQQDEFDDTVKHLEMLLEQYQINPCRIKLEITEMVLLDDLDKARKTMQELNKRGVGVFLDDFGTGYSNLVNAMTLPFQCVKIDKGFIRDISENSRGYGMLQTVVSGLKSLGVSVLAEGVETCEQDEIVRMLGIDQIQGYFYARPMLGDEFIWLLSEHKPLDANESCFCEY